MSSLIVDLFTEFQTKMRTEMALLMTKVMEIQNLKVAENPTADDKIIKGLEERLSLLEARLTEKSAATGGLTPQKRRLSEAAMAAPAPSPITAQLESVSQIIEPLSTMALETADDTDEEMSTESPTKRQRQDEVQEEAVQEEAGVQEDTEEEEEAEAEEEAGVQEDTEEEEEAVQGDSEEEAEAEEAAEEEAAEEEAAEEEAAEEELTEFMYKGKKYFMDSECQVYGLDAAGELNDEPIGLYDEKTRRITFNA